MREESITYLNSIDMSSTLIDRAGEVFRFYAEVCPEEITDIFVSEYVNEEGAREYENLWILSANYAGEALNFLDKEKFDLCLIRYRLGRVQVEMEHYDFEAGTPESRLHLSFSFGVSALGLEGEMKASGSNCDHLKAVLLRYIVPNLGAQS